MLAQRKEPGEFQVYHTSEKSSELLGVFSQTCFEFAQAEGPEQDAVASRMNAAKRDLVEYLELLEERVGIEPKVAYRF